MVGCLTDPSAKLAVDLSPGPDHDMEQTKLDKGHILVVDDQPEICALVQEYLSSEGHYRVSTAQDGAGMRRVMAQSPVDLVILDLILPGEDGLTLARSIRNETNVGIIILSGRGEPVERIIGLEWARTTTCQSRSSRASSWLGSRACCGGPQPEPRRSSRRPDRRHGLPAGPSIFRGGSSVRRPKPAKPEPNRIR